VPDATIGRQPHASDASSTRSKRGAGYTVFDPLGQKIGSAEEIFANPDGEPMYIRVRIGLLFSRTVLIPVQFLETDEKSKTLIMK
jgi:hypothetical protein